MNKTMTTILATVAIAFGVAPADAGIWAHGYYYDGPVCTVCDGARVIRHAYGTTLCAHCDGTGLEPPEVAPVVIGTWCAPPPPPPPRPHHRRPAIHPKRPPHHGVHPAPRRPAPPRPAAGRAPRPQGGNGRAAGPAKPARGGGRGRR